MKRIVLLLTLLLTLLISSAVFGESTEYKVYIDRVEQPFTALMDEDVYLPLRKTYEALGGKYTNNTAYDMDVYVFDNTLIEIYNDDYSVYEDDMYIGMAKRIHDTYYGAFDTVNLEDINVVIDKENREVRFLTLPYIYGFLAEETIAFEAQAPELVAGINALMASSVEMDLSGTLNMNIQALDPEIPASVPFKRMTFSGGGKGYIDLQKPEFDIEINAMMDTGGMTTKLKGIQMKLVDSTMFFKYPLVKGWIVENFTQDQMAEFQNDPYYQKDQMAISIFRNYIVKNNREDGKLSYSINLDAQAIENLSNDPNYGDFFIGLKREMQDENNGFDFIELNIEYILDNNEIVSVQMYFDVKIENETEHIDMTMEANVDYKNRGIEKEIKVPNPSEYLAD